jgi:hypothetical protein
MIHITEIIRQEKKSMNRKLYRKVAREHGVSVKEVKRDMQTAIDEAYKKPNFYAGQVPHKGVTPTPDEFIAHATSEAKLRINV